MPTAKYEIRTTRYTRRRGITLLEVLVAAVVLSVGMVGALEVIARCAATSQGAQDRARALMFARSKMEEILKEPTLQTGTDRGEGVDTSTDYDWEANIEQSQNSSLYTIIVTAKNRVTGLSQSISTLRRPDIQTPPEGTATSTGTSTDTDADAGGAGGAAGGGQ